MKQNKFICPECGGEMLGFYNKPALNLVCFKFGYRLAITKWDGIDLDNNNCNVYLTASKDISLEQIKIVSKISGNNFILSKKIMENGGTLISGNAKQIKQIKNLLEKGNINFYITPNFKC